MNRNLLIISTDHYGPVVKEIAEAMGGFEKIDVLEGQGVGGLVWSDDIANRVTEYSFAVAAVSDPERRLKWIERLTEACFSVPALVHPRAYVSPSAQIQQGCIVEPNATVSANVVLTLGVIVSAGAVVQHNSFVGDGCHIDAGAIVGVGSVVKAGTYLLPGDSFSGANIGESHFLEGMD